jgi:hypothetical protein
MGTRCSTGFVAGGLVTASVPMNQQKDDIVGDLFDSNLVARFN